MSAFKDIMWFVGTIASITAIFELVGFSGLVRMFPEGRRWWQFPAQLLSLAAFAALVLVNPFSR